MGSFFEVSDDPLNQRVFLQRCLEGGANTIYLETDPTIGGDISAIPSPPEMSKVDIGSVVNTAGYIIKYKDGVKLGFATNLPTTKAITTGTPADVTVVVSGGNIPYTYSWAKNGAALPLTAATIHFTGVAGDAGSYVCTVKDSFGLTITSATMVVTVT